MRPGVLHLSTTGLTAGCKAMITNRTRARIPPISDQPDGEELIWIRGRSYRLLKMSPTNRLRP
ncbi:hypothetical protein BDW68DRAFT_171605 [Aspergillus falconensis]